MRAIAELGITAKFNVTAIVGGDKQAVRVAPGATIKDVWALLNTDLQQVVPVIRGRVADWLTHLVPGTVINFV